MTIAITGQRLVVVLSCIMWLVHGVQNPCHSLSTVKNTPSASCEKVTLPTGMCAACKLGALTTGGHYVDCTRAMDVESASCQAKLTEYIAMNPCDTARAQAMTEYKSSTNPSDPTRELGRQKLDYFAYSVCENST
jgi:hypothetical protein